MAYESIKCSVCGYLTEQSGKGRPKERHSNCRKIEQFFSWLENHLSCINATIDRL